ncbi:alpha/beta hydrolase family protein [Halovenus marina]|uniref:alpha/beta hydrolase family protein n=1 Tax=Halovenus marina TaxID=3396621 RepID=UPI003F54A387
MTYTPPNNIEPRAPQDVQDGEVRSKLRELLGVTDPPEDLRYSLGQERIQEDLQFEEIQFENSIGETVTGKLIVPQGKSNADKPAIVCTPGTSGNANRLTEETFRREEDGPLRGWARELSRRGYVTLSLTLHLNKSRQGNGENYIERKTAFLAPYGISTMGLLVDEVLRGVQILSDHAAVDSERIGLTGMSLGGNATWYSFACEPNIPVAAPICGSVGSLHEQILFGNRHRHGTHFYIPHMLRYFDHPTIVRKCITPRPFFVVAPMDDEDMPATGVDRMVEEAIPAYERAGTRANFAVHRPDGTHEFRQDYFERMADWFETHL